MLDLAISLFLISLALYFFVKTLKNILVVIILSIVLMLIINYLGIKFNIPFLQPVTTILSYFFSVNLYKADVSLVSDNGLYSIFEINNTGKLPIKLKDVYANGIKVNFTVDKSIILPNKVATLEVNSTNINKIKLIFDKLTVEKII